MVAQSPMRPQTLLPPVYPGLLGILGAPADSVSCQNIADTTWYETTKKQTQGSVGSAARQALPMNTQRAATPSTSCCVPKTSHLSATQPLLPDLCLCKGEIQSSRAMGVKINRSLRVTWGGTGTLSGQGDHSKENCFSEIKPSIWLGPRLHYIQGTGCLFVFDSFLCSLSNPLLKTTVLSIPVSFN